MPLPLSLMPGPSMTESRCAPTTTISSAFLPLGESAITLTVLRFRSTSTRGEHPAGHRAGLGLPRRAPRRRRSSDRTTGIVCGVPRVPVSSSVRPGLALVEDHHRVVAGGSGVGHLDLEVAAAALDQRDGRFGGGGREVRRLAAGRAAAAPASAGCTMSLVGTIGRSRRRCRSSRSVAVSYSVGVGVICSASPGASVRGRTGR